MENIPSQKPQHSTPLSQHRRAILIGASSGIGAALAKQLAKEGWTLALLARRNDKLASLCNEINEHSKEVQAIYYQHDVNHHYKAQVLLQTIIADLGGLDLFVYLTGLTPTIGVDEYNFEQDKSTTEVNYIGALAWLNPIATFFQSLHAGQIVGISSVAGDRGRIGNPAYNASKAALTCYLEALRNRLNRVGVHVLTVKPGLVANDLTNERDRKFLSVPAEKIARDISYAIQHKKQVLYTPWYWRWIMLIIQHTPSILFRRLSI